MTTGYLAPKGFLADLQKELGTEGEVFGDLVLTDGPEKPPAWVANIWRDPVRIPIASIGDGVKKLKAIQRNWAFYPIGHHRRAALIIEQLPKVSAKPLAFGTKAPKASLGSWTLIERDVILASPNCSSAFPNGEVNFVEDRQSAPSRAYLKLWELFTVLDILPKKGDLCLDLGATPGGWSWVLQQLGANVICIDKASLDPRIVALPGIEYRKESAFGLEPKDIGPVDWLFSDVVCYPKRLLTLVQKWMKAGTVKNFACTIKFQGETDFETIEEFKAIPGSRLMHLYHNKHELTWVKLK
jgi:23S rRNA (cytidine2498-2'-O)-methyltransferase